MLQPVQRRIQKANTLIDPEHRNEWANRGKTVLSMARGEMGRLSQHKTEYIACLETRTILHCY